MMLPMFPDELRVHFDEFGWRIGKLTQGTRASLVDDYLLVFHYRAPDVFDKYNKARIRFGIFSRVSRQPILVVAGKHGMDVWEWGSEEEIMAALKKLRQLTLLDELADV